MFLRVILRKHSTFRILKLAPYLNFLQDISTYSYKIGVNQVAICNVNPYIIKQRNFSQETSQKEHPTVNYDYVNNAVNKKDTLIVDVREPDELKEHGYIPSSINIPLGTVSSALKMSDKEFEYAFKKPKPKQDTEIIFYCMIGKRSGKAQESALGLGFKNVKNYLGSWTDWAQKTTRT